MLQKFCHRCLRTCSAYRIQIRHSLFHDLSTDMTYRKSFKISNTTDTTSGTLTGSTFGVHPQFKVWFMFLNVQFSVQCLVVHCHCFVCPSSNGFWYLQAFLSITHESFISMFHVKHFINLCIHFQRVEISYKFFFLNNMFM